MKTRVYLAILCTAIAAMSCTGLYDNVKEFGDSETVYSGKLDGVFGIKYGYERVEIDLMEAGRLSASSLNYGRASKTVIYCEDFTEPSHERVIDSLCSWVNITGLTQTKVYTFSICTEDKYGNRSLPVEVSVTPFTRDNMEALSVIKPYVLESDGFAKVEWKNPVSNELVEIKSYSYEYTDRDGNVMSGDGNGDLPSFMVENILAETDVPVIMDFLVRPSITLMENGKTKYQQIIDDVHWKTPVNIRISSDAKPYIFLLSPDQGLELDVHSLGDVFPCTFKWTKVNSCNDYVIKFSTNSNFTEGNTYELNVGDVNEYEISEEQAEVIFNSFGRKRSIDLVWGVFPVVPNPAIDIQQRNMKLLCSPMLVGEWLFDDASNPGKATVGEALQVLGGSVTAVEEDGEEFNGLIPDGTAVEVPGPVYFKCRHLLPERTSLTLQMWVKIPAYNQNIFLTETEFPDDPSQSPELRFAVGTYGFPGGMPTQNVYAVGQDTWHLLFYVADGDTYTFYLDGFKTHQLTRTGQDRWRFRDDFVSFFGANTLSIKVASLRLWDMPMTGDEIFNAMGLSNIPKSEMTVVKYLETMSPAAGNPQNALNNNAGDNSPWVGRFNDANTIPGLEEQPVYMVIDLGKRRKIKQLGYVSVPWGGSGPKTVEFFVGDSYTNTADMKKVLSMRRSAQGWSSTGLFNYAELPSAVSGRYLMVQVTDMFNQNCGIREILAVEEL